MIGKFNPDVEKYLGSENKVKFLSPQIQNEVLKDLAHTLLRGLLDRIRAESIGVNKKESVFSIILDETSDINRNEQVSVCVRFCNSEINSEEVFLGFHMTKRTTADALLSLLKSSLTAFNLPFSGIRGQGYDGASNMSGRNNGLQAKVAAENFMALYLYCFGHQLNLVVQDSLCALPEVAIALERMNGVVTFVRNSPKKMGRFKEILEVSKQENEASNFTHDNHSIRPLCPTRWVMRLPAIDAFLSHYSSIIDFLVDIKEDRTEPVKNRGEADSFLRSLETFQNYFCLRVVQKILQIVQPVHVMCQGPKSTAGDVRGWVNTLALTLTAEGSNVENATALYHAVKHLTVEELQLDLPALPRIGRARGTRLHQTATQHVTEELIATFMLFCTKQSRERQQMHFVTGIVQMTWRSWTSSVAHWRTLP